MLMWDMVTQYEQLHAQEESGTQCDPQILDERSSISSSKPQSRMSQ